MSKALEALERLVMPDDLYQRERERLGLTAGHDYDLIKKELQSFEILKKNLLFELTTIELNDSHYVLRVINPEFPDKYVAVLITKEEYETLKGVLPDETRT